MSKAHANLSMGINALLLTAKNWRFLIVRIKANAFNQYVVLLITIYNRENETYNFLKRNVQFSLFFHPIKAKAFNHHLSGN